MTIKITIYSLVTDTDSGTDTFTFTSEAEADAAYVAMINEYVERENRYLPEDNRFPLAETFEEASETWQLLVENHGVVDSVRIELDELELGPKPPAEGLRRFYVVKAWDDFPEGGTCGEIIWAKDHEDAEAQMVEIMLDYRQDEWIDDPDGARESFRDRYAVEWETIDCWPLDEFIERNLAA